MIETGSFYLLEHVLDIKLLSLQKFYTSQNKFLATPIFYSV